MPGDGMLPMGRLPMIVVGVVRDKESRHLSQHPAPETVNRARCLSCTTETRFSRARVAGYVLRIQSVCLAMNGPMSDRVRLSAFGKHVGWLGSRYQLTAYTTCM